MKVAFKPGTMIYPLPAVMVTCGDAPENWNIITVAWTGTLCSDPPMCYISVRPERHSHALIERTGEFVINLTTEALARQTDWCAVAANTTNSARWVFMPLQLNLSRLRSSRRVRCR